MDNKLHPLHVSLVLDHIACIDEGDGPGTAEPYLWVLFFKIDGDTVRISSLQEGGNLRGAISVSRRDGAHGNLLNRDVDAGDEVPIPPSLGRWDTTLTPIPFDVPLDILGDVRENVPGIIGVVYVLMEENFVATSAIRAGYDAFCSTLEAKLNEKINTLGFSNQELSEEDVDALTRMVTDAATDAVEGSLDFAGKLAAWLFGKDLTLGTANFRFNNRQLIDQSQIFFESHWILGHPVDEHLPEKLVAENPLVDNSYLKKGEWKFFGHISAKPVEQFIGTFGPVITFDEEELAMRDFRHRAEVAEKEGFVGAFPNFYTATYGRSNVGGTIFINPACGEARDVRVSDLGPMGYLPLDDFGERFRATHRYALKQGFVGGFPNFFHAAYSTSVSRSAIALPPRISGNGNGNGLKVKLTPVTLHANDDYVRQSLYEVDHTVCGTVFIKPGCGVFRYVPLGELGSPSLSDVGARFRATQDYAIREGFVGGFPNFFHTDYGNGLVCGTILLGLEAAQWKDVLLWIGPA